MSEFPFEVWQRNCFLEMYGDPEELRQNLSIYSNFTGQQHCFDYSIDDSYQVRIQNYYFLNEELSG